VERSDIVEVSVLHQIQWLRYIFDYTSTAVDCSSQFFRLVVDEGHSIGKYGLTSTDGALMATSISADRRFAKIENEP
jgi:hypothetical protein